MQVTSDERICSRCGNNIWIVELESRWLRIRSSNKALTCTQCGRGYLADKWEMKNVFKEVE